mmetsp:Transcript_134340/g.199929  ORF Transcript_134340/g.199929 Transcript_134340/m.199929 type:complete len:271 (+) Transcript_134340:160-972(+)|eukprot:CAMPEP_0117030654 /NCGR_PEP_ID=MMETSP0472-20121206/22112_1 /TAXON_ID=693140 ORGANISM="Tiarina fusus, Strain LIS" /NCGR_SAMPLE_ID=MMETSP0472 /ASSEMBLY_ACC=CAM_ASM_000603 /LENGTH=270 /DNA_ID=CAMNT_0004738795 /DNA_START=153 /DNA_END=965 /DNA_ORIENTATION=+
MTLYARGPKYRGLLHDAESSNEQQQFQWGYGSTISPHYVDVPGIPYRIAQYAPTVRGVAVPHRFDPANDCDGYFMSFRFESNNNCYNYACNIASNSFAQPGRKHGFMFPPKSATSLEKAGRLVTKAAELDGLVYVGKSISEDVKTHAQAGEKGHYVALLIAIEDVTASFKNVKLVAQSCGYIIAKAFDDHFRGDLHWVRCDDPKDFASWSQKDGRDAVTNFDFAGHKIIDPSKSNWTANGEGSILQAEEFSIVYEFYGFFFVPADRVDII